MTPGDNGASTPEDDDPFGYLYADGQARGAQPPSGGYGYPNSVSRVRAVGERQYGQQAPYGQQPPAGYGDQTVPVQQQGAYGQSNAHYQAPETFPGGAGPGAPQPTHGGGGRNGRGPNTKGLLIGAIAVVAAVVIGISVAMFSNTNGDKNDGAPTASASTDDAGSQESASSSPTKTAASGPGVQDAAALPLGGGAQVGTEYSGARAAGGKYVDQMTQPGASVTWKVDVPKAGTYDLWMRYANAEKDAASATTVVNGKALSYKPDLQNYGKEGDWNAWYRSYVSVQLDKGTNTVAVTCGQGDACHFNLDQLALLQEGQKPGW
ncbi:CBM35 domain-containing protein [Streptomyces sp. MMS24-I2-30]|uniref:CBM35 domain-containing protein n=1 Tax=Streptomyces sp. MMS24-I2-30 TaxID=3351564 RepID=UPI0038969FC4